MSSVTIVFYDKVRGWNKAQRWLLYVCWGFYNLKKIQSDTFSQDNIMAYIYSIENDSDSVILLLGSAQILSTAQWEITLIVQCWNSYRALQIKETYIYIYQCKTICIWEQWEIPHIKQFFLAFESFQILYRLQKI